jgi:hypothetical protein
MTLLPRLWSRLRTLLRWPFTCHTPHGCPQCGQCLTPLDGVDRWEVEQGRGQWCLACGWEANREEKER